MDSFPQTITVDPELAPNGTGTGRVLDLSSELFKKAISSTQLAPGEQNEDFSLPLIFRINTKIPQGLKIIKPIYTTVFKASDTEIIVSDDIFYMYGIGSSIESAIRDYLLTLSEFYQIVEESLKGNNRNQVKFTKLSAYISRENNAI